jgi:AbrB family looped-hinge helix DNA binding protein
MNTTNLIGIIRSMDDLGRVVIPWEIRNVLGMQDGAKMEIFTTADGEIILRKATVNEVDGVLVKVENKVSVTPTPAPDAPIHMYFQNEYDYDDVKRMIVTSAQMKVIDYLSSCDLLNADYIYREGEPECEWDDLTK